MIEPTNMPTNIEILIRPAGFEYTTQQLQSLKPMIPLDHSARATMYILTKHAL
jgi:hypothetical protein